jgi:hypothetical protein
MRNLVLALCLLFAFNVNAQNTSLIHDDHAQLRKLGNFTSIKVSSAIDLYLTQAGNCQVAVSAANEEYRDKIVTVVEGGTLIIKMQDRDGWFNWKSWGNTKAKAYVSVKELDALMASGATNVHLMNQLEMNKLKLKLAGASDLKGDMKVGNLSIEVSGASDYKGQVEAKNMSIEASGASKVELSGMVDDLSLEVSGASDAKLYNLIAKGAVVNASGASTANINVSQLIKAEASGASSINYKGQATVKEILNSGASKIKHRD